ncbi:MAG: glycosyltransferase family 9 protein [Planctomycetes bacterium]|nr:glycosyltransferase family 9 protein [Planctomycetota bacterium]MCL4730291.1 glycosyltransferase family 9 protein [Planctomycetota bacterium]
MDARDIDLAGRKLLLIKPSSLGDVCHAAASAWALKARWPTLHLTWLVNTTFEPLVKPLSCVDATLPFERSRFKGLLGPLTRQGELRSFSRQLRQGEFDAVLDLQGLFRSGLFAWLTRAPLRVGGSTAREGSRWFHNLRVPEPPQPVHARDRYDAITAALDCARPARQDLDVRDTERDRARALLRDAGFEGEALVALCPGARWETKLYPARHWAAVLDDLAARAGVHQPVLVGSPDMAGLCEETVRACSRARPVNLCGATGLRELAALLDMARLVLTCDSGPMHIAAAQGTPVVAVMGSTDPRRTGPYGQLHNVVTGRCELMPCLRRHCPQMGLTCMRDLDPLGVSEKALALLAAAPDKVRT